MKNKNLLISVFINTIVTISIFFSLNYIFNNQRKSVNESINTMKESVKISDKEDHTAPDKNNKAQNRENCVTKSSYNSLLKRLAVLENSFYKELEKIDRDKLKKQRKKDWLAQGKLIVNDQIAESKQILGEELFMKVRRDTNKTHQLYQAGKHEDVIRNVGKMLEETPDNVYTGFNLMMMSDSYAKMGKFDKTKETAIDVMEKYPESRIPDGQQLAANSRLVVARICQKQGDVDCFDNMKRELETYYSDAVLGNGKKVLELLK